MSQMGRSGHSAMRAQCPICPKAERLDYGFAAFSDGASLNGDGTDRACLERAANPLHGARVNAKLFGNDADTGPPGGRQSLTDSFLE